MSARDVTLWMGDKDLFYFFWLLLVGSRTNREPGAWGGSFTGMVASLLSFISPSAQLSEKLAQN